MLVLGLISCIVLRALSAQAKVVRSFEECKEFLYQGTEPRGMDQNAKKICQKLQNRGFYYASLYSVRHKIPLYSAYTLDPYCSSDTERKDIWHLEPQISQSTPPMYHQIKILKTFIKEIKPSAATTVAPGMIVDT
ncbi:endonuclease domain-containing 1 protein-like [Onychostoma macrolepis]|uniref:endonuclease domain-containing 1 protein-like n=1 Tax=Onychostoma macrolepis TaxID=369639 RepID=UPI00272C9572|nr:endonuclease domain-containing 1 protein-like [Onychostoma macrolepis]